MYCSKCGANLNGGVKCHACGEETRIIAYDYKTVRANGNAMQIADYYESLGWEPAEGSVSGSGMLSFKRNRRINNKEQLNRLMLKLDDGLESIDVLERKKTQKGTVVALILGVIGSLIFGGGMSLCIAWQPTELWMYIVGGILAAIGVVPCALAYYAYLKTCSKQEAAMNILIEKKRDEIIQICEEGYRLATAR